MPTRKQCKKCPWKKSTNPHDIPNGYCEIKHAGLADTIAEPGKMTSLTGLRIMACHESTTGNDIPCVGWLDNQLNDGNNLPLRYAVMKGRVSADYKLVGKQHTCFEDTLPKAE